MLSAEGGDLGLDESNASMSLTSEGVRGLLVLLRLVDGPRDGLQDCVICQQQCMGSKYQVLVCCSQNAWAVWVSSSALRLSVVGIP